MFDHFEGLALKGLKTIYLLLLQVRVVETVVYGYLKKEAELNTCLGESPGKPLSSCYGINFSQFAGSMYTQS